MAMVLALVLPGAGYAVQPDEVLKDAALEQRARALSTTLRCVVCQNQSIDDSDAPLARDLRLLVRDRLVPVPRQARLTELIADAGDDGAAIRALVDCEFSLAETQGDELVITASTLPWRVGDTVPVSPHSNNEA